MLPQQATLARRRARENIRIKAEIHKRNKALRDPAIGVVNLQQIAHLVGTIGAAAVPQIAAEDHHITPRTRAMVPKQLAAINKDVATLRRWLGWD